MSEPNTIQAPADLPFEAAIARLEVIVKTMEGDTVSLDESLSLYEEGIALVRRLSRELDEAEQRVQILQRTPDGEIKPAPFTSTED
ncbi:MAG: exodeoxyribonuclease VII small subunit [Clostridia bacterium]|nr:exodeoxyribonuclease VII small subunit [Clostridia bacterium]